MKQSTKRILTTHVGSMPRPQEVVDFLFAEDQGELSDEQRAILQAMVNDFYSTFKGLVRKARPGITEQNLVTATDGRIFTGKQALKIGLIDKLGDLHDALAAAKKASSIKRAKLVLYHRKAATIRSPYEAGASTNPAGVQVNLAQINLANTFGENTPMFMYLYQPLSK